MTPPRPFVPAARPSPAPWPIGRPAAWRGRARLLDPLAVARAPAGGAAFRPARAPGLAPPKTAPPASHRRAPARTATRVRRRHFPAARRPSRRRRDRQPQGQPQPEPHSGPRADHRRALRSADHLQRLSPPRTRRAPSGSAGDRAAPGVAHLASSGRGPSPPTPSPPASSLPMR